MNTWIFQASPDQFDLPAYLSTSPVLITWSVKQGGNAMRVGDRVYMWNAKGKRKSGVEASGILAECRIAGPVTERLPPAESAAYWVEKSGDAIPGMRVDLLVVRVARKKEMIKREWVTGDPVLKDMQIVKAGVGTNFSLSEQEAERVRALWTRSGIDWTWRDSVAGLWAYAKTKGTVVSQRPGSPVATVALAIGRSVTGVYNKVMNFRALDPTDDRQGLAAGGETDEQVWARFFAPSQGGVDMRALEEEVSRLGLRLVSMTGAADAAPAIAIGTEPQHMPRPGQDLTSLLNHYQASIESGAFSALPSASAAFTTRFDRNPFVVDVAKARAGYRCEMPGCSVPTFVSATGEAYCEVHHIDPLAEGGEDVIENTICLCPNHHREAHFGAGALALRTVMRRVRAATLATGHARSVRPEAAADHRISD